LKLFDKIINSFSLLTTPFVAIPVGSDVLNNEYWHLGLKQNTVELDNSYPLSRILYSKKWVELTTDLDLWVQEEQVNLFSTYQDTRAGAAFSYKYSQIDQAEDARYVASDWNREIKSVYQNLRADSRRGALLHVGSDLVYEPSIFHESPEKIQLINISRALLRQYKQVTPRAEMIADRAENLKSISDNSVDMYVALRVYSSHGFCPCKAITEAARVLKNNGCILISECNGYRAYDDTIIPGQIYGTPVRLSFSRPFHKILTYLKLLTSLGFVEIEVTFGAAEIYITAIFRKGNGSSTAPQNISINNNSPPLRFYGEDMPTSWLGNFYASDFFLDEHVWPSVENYFQTQKFTDGETQTMIMKAAKPSYAKAIAWERDSLKRSDWNMVRDTIMFRGVLAKFEQNLFLRNLLSRTGCLDIEELSSKDMHWGVNLQGVGRNEMGEILCRVRDRL
jgi:ribA/ribD-fused uncharacterized protein